MSTYDEMRQNRPASSTNKPKKRVAFTDKEFIYMEISDEEMERMLKRPGAKRLDGEATKKAAPKSMASKPAAPKSAVNKPPVKRPNPFLEQPEDYKKTEKPKVMEAKNHKRPVPSEKKKKPIFWICLGAWAFILIVLGIIFLSYTDKCLKQYEAAQPNHKMDVVLEDVKAGIADGSIVSEMELPAGGGEFEDAGIYGQLFLASAQGASAYTYQKDASSYNTEAPIYDIMADDKMVAKVTLHSYNEKTIFGILTIMDWEVASIEPVINVETKDYTITVPSVYMVAVNGVTLSDQYVVSNSPNPDYANVEEYVAMPTDITYEVKGLVNEPSITLTDAKGVTAPATITDGKVVASISGDSMPEDRKEMVFEIAKTWQNFMTNDLAGNSHGLGTVRQYLIKDSYYWNLATQYAGGVDITFMSAHNTDGYTEPVIDEYVEYSENCFSCHISYVKNMTLTRNGDKVTDEIDSTFYFVNYDDSDDGQDNPHWAMVDMIAKTK